MSHLLKSERSELSKLSAAGLAQEIRTNSKVVSKCDIFKYFYPLWVRKGRPWLLAVQYQQQPLKQSSRRLGSSTTEACPKLSHEFQMSSWVVPFSFCNQIYMMVLFSPSLSREELGLKKALEEQQYTNAISSLQFLDYKGPTSSFFVQSRLFLTE